MPSLVEGISVVITGATSGIGLAVARALSQRGARLALVARTRERLERVAQDTGGTAFTADLSDTADVERLTQQLTRQIGDAPDIVINAAGAFDLAPITETSIAAFDAMMTANLRAPFLLMRAFLPRMLERRSGHLVSIGSVAGRQALPGNAAYSASKFGLRGLHEVLALELRGTGVRATLIEPAATDTPLWDVVDYTRIAGLPQRAQMLTPDAVARCVVFALEAPVEQTVRYIGIERS